jgi:hypothetical protein
MTKRVLLMGSRMDTIVDEIRDKMAKFPKARVQHDASSITYLPDTSNGFEVRLVVLKKNPHNEVYSVSVSSGLRGD